MKRAFYILIGLIFILSCGNKKQSVKPYYFPYADFFTPKVYKYINMKDTTQVQYWRFETGAKSGDTVMTTGIYNGDLKLVTVYHNKITDDGTRLQLMFVNMGDTNNLYQCEIKKDESFNWEVDPKIPMTLSFGMKTAGGAQSTEVVSERMVESKKETLSYNNENFECIVIKESTMFNYITNNRTRSEEQQRTSYFAKGVGLIRYETFHADGKSDLFTLDGIIIDKDRKMFLPAVNDSSSAIQ